MERLADQPDKFVSFATTQWTVILAAAGASPEEQAAALEQLCQTYWQPVYSYIRRRGNGPDDAQDLTQEFFARLLEKRWLDRAHNNGSRFRSFLLTAVNGFLANEYDRSRAAKRGGGQKLFSLDAEQAERRYLLDPATSESPEKLFDRRWAFTVLERAHERLKTETAAARKERSFELLNTFLSREPGPGEYEEVARQLGVSAGAVGVSVHRLRQRFRDCVKAEVAGTLVDPSQVESEMADLFTALRME